MWRLSRLEIYDILIHSQLTNNTHKISNNDTFDCKEKQWFIKIFKPEDVY